MTASYRNILKATSLFTGVQGLNILLNIVRGKLAAVLLGPAGIGLNSIYNELREFIHETTNIGLDRSGVREIARAYGSEELLKAISLTRSWVMVLAAFGTLITIAMAEPLSLAFFDDSSHIWDFMLLAPAVGLSTISCGELTVLRGVQKLKTVAIVSVLHVVAGIVTTMPIYYFWGIRGVVPALVLLCVSMALIGIVYSYRLYRPEFCFRKTFLSGGRTMLILGFSFVLSGLVSHLSKLAVQGYLSRNASLDTVGMYAQILSLMTYSCILFTSLDTDYFPRLSGVFDNLQNRLETVKRQIIVTLAVALPIMMLILFALPVMIPLLMSREFLPIIPACQIMMASMICKALYLPMSYMPLSAGDSKIFLLMQTISYLCFVPAILAGYELWGLVGIGIGLAASNIFDVVCAWLCARIRYSLRLEAGIWARFLLMLAFSLVGYAASTLFTGWLYWTAGCIVVMTGTLASYKDIKKIWAK